MRKIAILSVIAAAVFTVAACGDLTDTPTTTTSSSATASAHPSKGGGDNLTAAQENALRSAKSYLEISGMSKAGLIKQLRFEKYSAADAKWAVDHVGADWKREAAQCAKAYLDVQGFSRAALVKQLKFDGFTDAEAAAGVKAAGL